MACWYDDLLYLLLASGAGESPSIMLLITIIIITFKCLNLPKSILTLLNMPSSYSIRMVVAASADRYFFGKIGNIDSV